MLLLTIASSRPAAVLVHTLFPCHNPCRHHSKERVTTRRGFLLSRQRGEGGECSAWPCSAPPYLHGLAVPPHHAFPIALPDEVHLSPCPFRGDAQLHLEPAGLPPGNRARSPSPRCGELRGAPLRGAARPQTKHSGDTAWLACQGDSTAWPRVEPPLF